VTWTGALAAMAALLVATGAGLALRRTSGRFRTPDGTAEVADGGGGTSGGGTSDEGTSDGDTAGGIDPTLAFDPVLAAIGVTAGTPVTLLQFSSAFCAPCRATRVLCAEVARLVPGVRHVEVDAESHLDAVRALDVWRTPTVLVLDATGTVRRRATGPPSRARLLAVVGDVLPERGVVTRAQLR
jgi:thiol-disulfide isomerase/thioredoxin